MDRACMMHEEKRNAYNVLMGKPERNRSLGRNRSRRKDYMKMNLRHIG
jgi:hypothetical protein